MEDFLLDIACMLIPWCTGFMGFGYQPLLSGLK